MAWLCAVSYLRESFDRKAKWILKSYKKSSTQISLKLLMFHVIFLRLFRYSQRSGTIWNIYDTKKKVVNHF